MEKVLNKVVFYYSDGTHKYIDENELDRWIGMNRQVAIFCNVHNANPRWEDVKWTWVENSTETIENNEEVYDENTPTAVD